MTQATHAELNQRYIELIDSQQSLHISSDSPERGAQISYAPFIREGLDFYIFVSELAAHTVNMQQQKQASIMFIQPEAETENIFARERVIFNCRVQEIEREHKDFDKRLQGMQDKFGDMIALLKSLPDFHLLQLTAVSGHYVKGFGQAYSINVETPSLSKPMGRK